MGRRESEQLRAASWRLTFEQRKPLQSEWEPLELFQVLLSSHSPLFGGGGGGRRLDFVPTFSTSLFARICLCFRTERMFGMSSGWDLGL